MVLSILSCNNWIHPLWSLLYFSQCLRLSPNVKPAIKGQCNMSTRKTTSYSVCHLLYLIKKMVYIKYLECEAWSIARLHVWCNFSLLFAKCKCDFNEKNDRLHYYNLDNFQHFQFVFLTISLTISINFRLGVGIWCCEFNENTDWREANFIMKQY